MSCADCGVALVAALPAEPEEPPETGETAETTETIEVWAGSQNLLHDFLANALTQAGIEVHARRDQSSSVFGLPGVFGPPLSLWVHGDEAGRARELIEECLKSFESESEEADAGGSGPA